ncbi:Acetoin catabolism regulatory protein [Vibrio aerogenes CECT 7868]|uniref:Acetoin catabolism regulatory protein n=1 Tax=Vibrio aerogenes CECT 7868 TaxID=1216006 RepID=A0A1M5Y3J6_9VIBR|nr:sigma-54-dependent Fis family transcriptional regulator [Vibrio aerogenes]SHI06631.1 Acetoin catabolism regulatory protein [Vibrio aerogenes CECT 7868]
MHIQYPHNDWLTLSWDRCSQAGLKQRRLPEHVTLPSAELKERRWMVSHLIQAIETDALPLFNQMFASSDSRLVLTDKEGVILATWGQPRFRERLNQIALSTGVCWQETLKGTNAIGTAIIEAKPLTINGKQHYIHQHQFISCSASPVMSPDGELIGILDISSEQQHHDMPTQMLLQSMVQMIENHLLCSLPRSEVKIHLACEQKLLHSGWQGVLVTDKQGHILAHNQIAAQLLHRTDMVGLLAEPLLLEANNLVHEKNRLKQFSARRRYSRPASGGGHLHLGDTSIEKAWQQAMKVIHQDVPMFISGETGVGKNEFVKLLHQQSHRSQHPLVVVNCGAIPKDLIESELFGYAPGAFTGAGAKGYQGKIRQASGGILFLDEIADMPTEAQCRLLHVLQEREVIPVGSNQSHQVDIQVIAATHKNIARLVETGAFRQDLYYRLNGLVIELPPLRQRQDKAALIEQIHQKYSRNHQSLEVNLKRILQDYHWPGNLRELDNVLKVSCLLAGDEQMLQLGHIPDHILRSLIAKPVSVLKAISEKSMPDKDVSDKAMSGSGKNPSDLKTMLDNQLVQTYQATQGNISQTSRLLGISRNTVYRKLKALGVMN